VNMRECNGCKTVLPLTMFGKNSRFEDGLMRICKQCNRKRCVQFKTKKRGGPPQKRSDINRRPHYVRLAECNAALSRSSRGKGVSTFETEKRSIGALEEIVSEFEIVKWQDGTASDIGVRPRDKMHVDRWLPLQIKSCSTYPVKFLLRNDAGELPRFDTILVILQSKSPTFLFLPKEEMCHLGIGNSGSLSMADLDKWQHFVVDGDTLEDIFASKWCVDDFVGDERALRWQVNESCMSELRNIEYSNMLHRFSIWSWPEHPMGVFDLIRDGQKEQYKTVTRSGNSFRADHVTKKVGGLPIPYEVGDNDWYVFGYLHEEDPRAYLEWRIPEAVMLKNGKLSVRNADGTQYVSAGNKGVTLHILGPGGQNQWIQDVIVGASPRSDAVSDTFRYLNVLWLD